MFANWGYHGYVMAFVRYFMKCIFVLISYIMLYTEDLSMRHYFEFFSNQVTYAFNFTDVCSNIQSLK